MDELTRKEHKTVLNSWLVDVDLALEFLLPPSDKKKALQAQFAEFGEAAMQLLDES